MKSVYKLIIRFIDFEEIVYLNNKQKVLENVLDIFLIENFCLQIFKLFWLKLLNYFLKCFVDICVDFRELILVGCYVIDVEYICFVGLQCRKFIKLEFDGELYDKGFLYLLKCLV